jgi:exosortase E/protease (VPEID-CTERM system)
LLGLDVAYDPDDLVIRTSTFEVQLAPACSGYEGIGLIWAFLGAYLWLFRSRLRFPRAFLLPVLGSVVIWLLNAVRIAALVCIGTWGWREVALGGFHSQAGWLAFNAVALGLVLLSQRLPYFRAGAHAAGGPSPAAAYLAPFLTLMAVVMVTGAVTHGFDWLYPVRVLAVAGVLLLSRRAYAGWSWSWSWFAVAVGGVVFALWLALEPARADDAPLPGHLASLPGWLAALWMIFRVLGSVVTVPLAEELAFRGYLLRRLQAADFQEVPPGRFSWLSFTVSSALFGALHPGRWLAGTLAGMLYAITLYRRGSLLDAAIAHGTTNALLAAYVIATGTWSLWS